MTLLYRSAITYHGLRAAPFLLSTSISPPLLGCLGSRLGRIPSQLHSETLHLLAVMLSFNLMFIALPVIHALAVQKRHNSTNVPMPLSSQAWFHPKDHPVHDLFKRGPDDGSDSVNYAAVGSPGESTWHRRLTNIHFPWHVQHGQQVFQPPDSHFQILAHSLQHGLML